MEINRVQLHWDLGVGKRQEVSSAGTLPFKDFPLHHLAAEGEFTSASHHEGIAVSGNELCCGPPRRSRGRQRCICWGSVAPAGRSMEAGPSSSPESFHLGRVFFFFEGRMAFVDRRRRKRRAEQKGQRQPRLWSARL